MKYLIRKANKQTGTVEYKRYKCIDGFSKDKSLCWQFSKKGAEKIIERLKREYYRNIENLDFDMEPVPKESDTKHSERRLSYAKKASESKQDPSENAR